MSKAFFVGIKGVGMTSLALAMQDAGWSVSGSDTDEVFITDDILGKRNIIVSSPVNALVPPDTDLIIHSAAYAKPQNLGGAVVMSLAEALSDFVKDKKVIAVAGVGGKTTTTAMLAAMFHSLGRDVGYYVGTGSIAGLDAPGHFGSDPYFVVEADEYIVSKNDNRPKFALLSPEIVITTNIIHDHPDIYKDESETLSAFAQLISHIKPGGVWIYNPSDALTSKLIDLQAIVPLGSQALKGIKLMPYSNQAPLTLSVFGSQNQLDAHAAVLAGVEAGLSKEQGEEGIKAYRGAGRRQEHHGEVAGRLLYDDYGHHPGEIGVTVRSFKEHFKGRRILLVFESHTYSRTEALLSKFARACQEADLTFIMPIFESAREKGVEHSVTPESFAALIPGARSLRWDNAAETVWQASQKGDIILTMGAGFVYKLHDQFKLLK